LLPDLLEMASISPFVRSNRLFSTTVNELLNDSLLSPMRIVSKPLGSLGFTGSGRSAK
jgi:hypothetical protein